MKKKMINATHIEGYVYEHKLENKTAGPNSAHPGVEFINGTLSIATDESCLNVVQVHFTYVTKETKAGKPNATYAVLQSIIDGKTGSVMEHGKENAGKVRIDSAIGLNEWYDNRTQGTPLVSIKRNEGGFVHLASDLIDKVEDRATFDADMLVTKATRIEADEERGLPEKVILKGYVFDFRNALLPVEFAVTSPAGMDYFEGLELSEKNPLFTEVRGVQVSQTVVKQVEEEGAFGDTYVKETKSSYREFLVKWVSKIPYEWDAEETMLASELVEGIAQREVALAEMKKRNDEWQATKGNAIAETPQAPANKQYSF